MSEENIDRRHQTNRMAQELREQQAQVWSLYQAIEAAFSEPGGMPIEPGFREFCKVLLDYIALGQFGVYRRISNGTERRRKVIELAGVIFADLSETTDSVIGLCEKYRRLQGEAFREQLAGDLPGIGEKLRTRIELENQLIEAML